MALKLAKALFKPTFKKGQELSDQDEYQYKDGLRNAVPALASKYGRLFLPELCNWLKAAVEARGHGDLGSGSDYSDVWRPAIEEHSENQDDEFAGAMVGFVRQGFELAVRAGCLPLEEALRVVSEYPYLVFKRIRLHLIAEFAEQNCDLARQVMLDRTLFGDHGCKHEHAMLMGRRFGMLQPGQQAEWLKWVNEGPTGEVAEALAEPDNPGLTERRREYWRFERLHWVRDHISGGELRFYRDMLTEHGEPEWADLNHRVGPARCGFASPMTVDELSGMAFEKAVDAISSWKGEKPGLMGPDIMGLASTFGRYVSTDPQQFSAKAQVLVGRPAIFVREFVSQMSKAIQVGREIDLPAVLELCNWIVSRAVDERTAPAEDHDVLVDSNWQWTREEISRLLENVCKAMSDGMPKFAVSDLRQAMWQLIEPLCRDRAESDIVHDLSQDDPRITDYLDLGINSPRGLAVEAALEYAHWVAKQVKRSDGNQEVVPGGFGAMPEVRRVLEWHIAQENRSFEAMSVIGAHMGLIHWIDAQWLADNAERLFQLEGLEKTPPAAQGWAAWNAFLVWVRPHIVFYRIFKSQYAYGVEQTARVELRERARHQPMYHLGEHLMLLYGHGRLGLDDDEGLLRRFVENSNAVVRRHAIGFVGEALKGDEQVSRAVIDRFMTLWDLYWAGPGRKDAEGNPDAFLFGPWFSCGHFPNQWALERLERFVQVAPTPEPDHATVKRLAEIAHVDIARSVRILDRMARGDQEGWRIDAWLDSAKHILGQAMGTTGEARKQAVDLINHLGRRGHIDLGQLLCA